MITSSSGPMNSSKSDPGALPLCRMAIGIVTDTKDPEHPGQVRVKYPVLNDVVSDWARIAAPLAGKDRGCYFPVQSGDEVLVAIVGERRSTQVFVVGALWNDVAKPPADDRDVFVIKFGNHVIELNKAEGKEAIRIADSRSDHGIVIDMAGKTVAITSAGNIELSAQKGEITLSAQTIDIGGANGVKIHGAQININ